MRRSYIFSTLILAIVVFLAIDQTGTAGAGRRRPPAAPVEVAPAVRKAAKKDSVPSELQIVQSYIDLTAKSLDRRAQGALAGIDGTPRKLLALRSYLLTRGFKGEWAWTNREMAAYRRSLEFRYANAEVDKVISLFQRRHPGLKLRTSKLARSLEEQVALWNTTGSIVVASTGLMKHTVRTMVKQDFPDTATKQSLAKFQTLIKNYAVRPVPTVAVPGMSDHGQLRAYDFIIWQGDKILAGSDGASIRNQWIGGGWSDRLRQIVYTASDRFDGPLESPHEPWHYTYLR